MVTLSVQICVSEAINVKVDIMGALVPMLHEATLNSGVSECLCVLAQAPTTSFSHFLLLQIAASLHFPFHLNSMLSFQANKLCSLLYATPCVASYKKCVDLQMA